MSSLPGEQFYVTHCGTADSVLGSPGYSVRAASVDAEDPLQFALAYPPYELPIDMWKERPGRADAPRRLARTLHPDGGLWVAHSAYLEKDSMDRDRSYFSHLLHIQCADPVAVLRSWGATEWATEYSNGSVKVLPGASLPVGSAISDDSLAAFLSACEMNGPAGLSVAICPARLRARPGLRRELVGRFLCAFAQARAGDSRRVRLFVHAEPGLVALLLYAAVRLLPAEWTSDLTFTTYEPPQRGLQDYKLAAVVGTFFGVPGKGLDAELVSVRAYGLDTVVHECSSAELREPAPAGLDELLALAAAKEWELVSDVLRLIGSEDNALGRLKSAVALNGALGRLNSGKATSDDLLALRADPRGVDALAHRLDDLRRGAAKALARGDLDGWDGRWAVVREVANDGQRKHQLERAMRNLEEYLAALSLPARSRLRAACAESGVLPSRALLASSCPEELEALLAGGVPAHWQGLACLAVLGPGTPIAAALRERARQFLLTAPSPVLGAFARAAHPHLEADPDLLAGLFRPYSPECRPRMDRLLHSDGLCPGDWMKLIHSLNLYTGDWEGYLLEGDRLARLLVALGGAGEGRDVWKGYLDELSPALLSPHLAPTDADGLVVHTWERSVFAHLKKAASELTAAGGKLVDALPLGGATKVFAARNLIRWVDDPGLAAKLTNPDEVLLACHGFGLAPLDLVRAAYLKGGFARLELPRDATALEPLLTLFRACFPTDIDFRKASTAVSYWVALSELCPVPNRAAFQAHLVCAFVPRDWHHAILAEPRHQPLLPAADACIRAALAGKQPEEIEEPAPLDDESPRRKKMRVSRRRGVDAGIGVWVVVVLLVVVAAVGSVAAFQILGGNKPEEVQPDRPPVKIEKSKAKK